MTTRGARTALRLPVGRDQARALLREVPFAASVTGPEPACESVSGYELVLCAPCWLNELLGNEVRAAVIEEIQIIEAHVLVYLQFIDDEIDGQSQIGPGDPRIVMAAAHGRLERLFPRGHAFWTDFQRLVAEQEASAQWEIAQHARPLPPFDEPLFRAIASKGALLRWPAAAMAHFAGRPDAKDFLDDVFARLLGVTLLLDDLFDVEEDAERMQVNSVLCAGAPASRDPMDFYPAVLRGAEAVCAKARTELEWLRSCGSTEEGFAATCSMLAGWFSEALGDVAEQCHGRAVAHVFARIADSLR